MIMLRLCTDRYRAVYVCFCEGVWELRVSTDALIIINYIA